MLSIIKKTRVYRRYFNYIEGGILVKRRLFILLVASLFLVSCSNVGPEYDITVNEDVDQKFAEDSIKMIQIFDKHLQTKNKPKFKDEDEDFMNKYIETYAGREVVSDRPRDPNFEMSVAEYQIYLKTSEFYGSYSPRAILLDDGTYLNGKKKQL